MQLEGGRQFDGVDEINLADNEISSCEFIGSNSLQRLDLQGNALRRLRLDRTAFPQLSKLNLTGNQISCVEVAEHPCLEILLVGDNQLKELEMKEWRLPNLHTLDLSNNTDLTELDFSEMVPSPSLKLLNLRDCRLTKLILPSNLDCIE